MKIDNIRRDFPVLRTRAFLDTASFCPYSVPVVKAIEHYLTFMSLAPSNTFEQFLLHRSPVEEAKKEAAELLNAKEKEIALINTTSQGMYTVANCLDWEKGNNVVTTDQTHPCCTITYMGLPGVELRLVKNVDGAYSLSDFEEMVDDDTKIITVCHTEWINGFTHDLKALRRVADDHGAYLMVDTVQSLGQLEVDVESTGLDFISCRCYKWQTGPLNGAILFVREELVEEFEPPFMGFRQLEELSLERGEGLRMWRMMGNQNPASHPIYSYENRDYAKTAARFEGPPIPAVDGWALNTALKYIRSIGIETIRKRNLKLSDYLIEGLLDIGCILNTPINEEKHRSGLLCYTTGSYESDYESVRTLNSMGVSVSLRYSAAEKGWREGMPHLGGIRVSTHFFNNEEDIDKLIELQKALLA